MPRAFLLACTLVLLAACGQKGPLQRPDDARQPVLVAPPADQPPR